MESINCILSLINMLIAVYCGFNDEYAKASYFAAIACLLLLLNLS